MSGQKRKLHVVAFFSIIRPVKFFPVAPVARLLAFLALLFAGCTAKTPPHFPPPSPASPPALSIPLRVDSDSFLPWASEEPALIVVDKECRTLNLYQYGHLVRSYAVVLGRQPGRKLYEGDQRTPTGLYMIIDKDHHRRWSRFMLLDYPTGQDVRRYWQNVAAGAVPRRGEGYPGVGGEVGIHGTDREAFNRVGINWTLGCISLFNLDVQELYAFVRVGTLVYIKD
jgi:murein L,D-transpeptidase YafK